MHNWADDEIEALKALWSEGHSASQIVRRLETQRSRNAIIGKVHRLGLSKRETIRRTRAKPRCVVLRKRVEKPVTPLRKILADIAVEPLPLITDDIPLGQRKTLDALEDQHCKWPVGDPKHADFHYCGGTRADGLPYCEGHAKRAYRALDVTPRTDYRPKMGRVLRGAVASVSVTEDA